MRRAILIALGSVLAVSCAPPPQPGPTPVRPPITPAPRPAPAEPAPPPPETPRDQCGAADLQRLVGRPRTEIPVPVDPSKRRVACTTCPVTQDYRPDRLNIFFDSESGIVKEVRCG